MCKQALIALQEVRGPRSGLESHIGRLLYDSQAHFSGCPLDRGKRGSGLFGSGPYIDLCVNVALASYPRTSGRPARC
eukprot:7698742-Pyramimonas_sp.AAC.1